jgi:hypothetical protein
MNQGLFLKCDPYAGWAVVTRDQWGNERALVSGVPTMEEAIRQAVITTGQPHYLKLELAP